MHAHTLESVEHLADEELTRSLHHEVASERAATSRVLVRIAEFDARRLYVPAGYPSMHAYCVGVFKFSDDEAYKRIQVARAGRKAPTLLGALAEGRIHLTAAIMLSPHLTAAIADELVEVASQRNKFELEAWIQKRFWGPSIEFEEARLPVALPEPVECLSILSEGSNNASFTATAGSGFCNTKSKSPPADTASRIHTCRRRHPSW